MRKFSEYDNEDTSHIIMGAQPHRLARKSKHNSKSQNDSEHISKIHDKYSRTERRSFIQVANKIYCHPVVH